MLIRPNQYRQLIQNPLFICGGLIIVLNLIVALGGSFIRPDSSPFANDQHLEIAALKPMSKVTFLRVERNEAISKEMDLTSYFVGSRKSYDDIPIDSAGLEGHMIVFKRKDQNLHFKINLLDAFFSLQSNSAIEDHGRVILANGAKIEVNLPDLQKRWKERLHEKTFELGTDKYGRDLLSRLMAGTYISLSVGIISVFISLLLGISLGLLAGYFRGWTDRLIVWIINVVWSVPTLLLVIAITLVLGKGFWQIFVAVGLTMWVEVARIVRGQVLSVREKEYIEAGTVLGFSHMRIILKHVLPNVLSPVIVVSAANFATAILLEAGLSFLGIGTPPPQATWGKMISEHKAYIITGDAHLAIIPGIAIMLLVLSFTFIGNALRDALDERLEAGN